MKPEKLVISGKTVYLVKTLPGADLSSCHSCCFYPEHKASYPGPRDCYETGRGKACQERGDNRCYVSPQKLRHHVLKVATARLTGETK